jgi:peptidoglycan/xylan/chitin deacetylase (PgdA/CDA1 family)
MNDRILRNVLKILISGFLYYSGIFVILNKMLRRRGILILNYHSFSTFTNNYWSDGSIYEVGFFDNFERQVEFLKRNIGFAESCYIKDEHFESSLRVLLTFDDGYLDNYQYAYPILKDHNVPAIFFVATKYIGTDDIIWHDKLRLLAEKGIESKKEIRQILTRIHKGELMPDELREIDKVETDRNGRLMMNWREVREIEDAGFCIGSHGRTHTPLSALGKEREMEEIKGSIEDISKHLSQDTIYFSFPNGSYSENTAEILKHIGINHGFSSDYGISKINQDRFRLKRIALNPSDPVCVLAAKVLMSKISG